MARRRGLNTQFNNTSVCSDTDVEDDGGLRLQGRWNEDCTLAGTNGARTMSLSHENRLDCNVSNNNDSNYLHKKFKKMASTIPMPSLGTHSDSDIINRDKNVVKNATNTSISNGSIAASHPEIEKIKGNNDYHNLLPRDVERNVQTTFNDKSVRLSDVNNFDQATGKTSYSNEFSYKTENLDNDFIKDVQNGTVGRYICPYCKLSCAKPSVLQKHIRAHTNERPYPCVPCGFAFKTKSNLYKHRRSRTHALRLQGADIAITNEDDLSAGSESDTSLPPTSVSDAGSEASIIRLESSRPSEFSSPELGNDCITPPVPNNLCAVENSKLKSIYKPKFRAAFYQEDERSKKGFSPNADFLNEHISKIISDNEAIVDVIETPLQKKYGKIKQIAESKQLNQINENGEVKFESTPLNLTKNSNESEIAFRKRSHSETFSHIDYHKHPLNPEGSIIKDLLLKTKINGLSINSDSSEGLAPQYICPLCQIPYRSADNLEIHRMYYCKGSASSVLQKDTKNSRPEHVFVRSHSINVRLPENQPNTAQKVIPSKLSPLRSKPDNLVIVKPESNDVIAPLPSPGPLLGNTRLVDTRMPSEYSRKTELKPAASPKRRIDSRSDNYSPRLTENISPRSSDAFSYNKIRCVESNLRPIDEMYLHNMKPNSTSLQMFGGEVKIVDHCGSTTTLRIEPSKSQLSPILVQQNLSPRRTQDAESNIVVRSGLHSGGTLVHNPPTSKNVVSTSNPQTPRIIISSAPSTSSMHDMPHFQFPPLSAITKFNPLTLPPLTPPTPNGATSVLHGGKLIPHVPGIPGPNTPSLYVATPNLHANVLVSPEKSPDIKHGNLLSMNIPAKTTSISNFEIMRNVRKSPDTRPSPVDNERLISTNNTHYSERKAALPIIKVKNVDETPALSSKSPTCEAKNISSRQEGPWKRGADGVPRTVVVKEIINYSSNKVKHEKAIINSVVTKTSEQTIRNFNFETMITKTEIYNNQIPSSSEVQKNANVSDDTVVSQNERSETAYFQKNTNVKSGTDDKKQKFLRPSTLPLRPGTFTPKRHHGITPNANTMPLVSPETPRPAKAYGQLYLNGNAYTYLGLKCSTKVFYCTINRPQPTYVPNQHFLSMYSNWQLLSELPPDPLGLSTTSAMSLYDSRHRPQTVVVSKIKQDLILTHSSQWNENSKDVKQIMQTGETRRAEDNKSCDSTAAPKKELTGGFESNEEYTYIRGRGRGRYVCSECGIRCKKPSMLKKHIRTHTDVRPYTCTHCAFSFKTKGNLTKHMKSKAHYKKCCELGINPNEGTDMEGGDVAQCSGETDDDSDSEGDEGNEGETESSDTEICKSRLPEHEAAHSLLSLGGSRPATSDTPGLITSARPSTYPYSPTGLDGVTTDRNSETLMCTGNNSIESRTDIENEPMDLSKNDVKTPNIPEIPTARESSVLASLASNTAKLPHQSTQWSNGEPMLHAYLTERALLDSKIKQSQLTSNLSKLRKMDSDKNVFTDTKIVKTFNTFTTSSAKMDTKSTSQSPVKTVTTAAIIVSTNLLKTVPAEDITKTVSENASNDLSATSISSDSKKGRAEGNAENAKFVVSEYLKHSRVNSSNDLPQNHSDVTQEDNIKGDYGDFAGTANETKLSDDEMTIKLPAVDPVARKVVIGAGGVAFKVTKGKEFDNIPSYSPGRLMEDGRRVCDFCNKTFTKPSQLRLHLNIHYMERPFRCSACAVSFRTRGHLQKHERSGSHHNKVSMTSTFGAATSLNPRPFRCSDCNIAFRIHGHLAKHLRSKMHVMRLECLFKLPFGTFTEIERAGVSLTDIDTTDCASSLASLQSLARRLHELDPSRLEYREPGRAPPTASPDDDDDSRATPSDMCDSERDSDNRTIEKSESHEKET